MEKGKYVGTAISICLSLSLSPSLTQDNMIHSRTSAVPGALHTDLLLSKIALVFVTQVRGTHVASRLEAHPLMPESTYWQVQR